MANKKVGTKTGKQTQAERDVYVTPEGENVSEKSTTFKYKGKWINVPSIHDGHRYDDDTLKIMLEAEIITPTSTHENRQEAEAAAKKRSDELKFNKGGTPMKDQMELFEDGGLKDEGGTIDEVSGNEVPIGGTKKGVRDDVSAMVSEGEFVFPEDVTRYIGLDKLMQMRQEAKMGLKRMEAMGQMGNGDEATIPDDMPFGMADLVIVAGDTGEELEMQEGGFVTRPTTAFRTQPQPTYTPPPQRPTVGQPTTTRRLTPEIERPERTPIDFKKLMGEASITYVEYRNAAGANMMIPHIGGVPVFPIPEGYTIYSPENEDSVENSNTVEGNVVKEINKVSRGEGGPDRDITAEIQAEYDNAPAPINWGSLATEDLLKELNGITGTGRTIANGAMLLFGPVGALGYAAMRDQDKRAYAAAVEKLNSGNLTAQQRVELQSYVETLGKTVGPESKSLFGSIVDGITNAFNFPTAKAEEAKAKVQQEKVVPVKTATTNTIQNEIEQVAPSYATMDMGEAGRTSRPMQEQVVSTQPAETAPVSSFIATDPRVSQTPVGAVADPTITNPDHRLIYGDSFSAGNNKFTIQNTGRISVTNPLGGTVEVNPLGRSLKSVQDEILNITGQPVTYTGPSPEEIVMQQPIPVPVGPTGGYDEQPIMRGAEILGQLEAPIVYGQPSPTAAKVEITPYEGSAEEAAGLNAIEQMRRMTEERAQQRREVIDPEFMKGVPVPDFDPRGRDQIPTVEQKQSSLRPVPAPVGPTGSYDEVPSLTKSATAATAATVSDLYGIGAGGEFDSTPDFDPRGRDQIPTVEQKQSSLRPVVKPKPKAKAAPKPAPKAKAAPKPAAKSVVARSNEKSTRLDSSNPNTSTNITNHLSNVEKESLKANPALAGHYTATANRRANEAAGGDTSNTDAANEASDNKIVCTAMNNSYGFGSYRQAIWLSYSKDHLTKEHELGYHTLFLPLVDLAYNKNNKFVRKALEHIARHRTADLRASMQNKKRDTLGRVYRSILEPLVYTVGKFRTITGI